MVQAAGSGKAVEERAGLRYPARMRLAAVALAPFGLALLVACGDDDGTGSGGTPAGGAGPGGSGTGGTSGMGGSGGGASMPCDAAILATPVTSKTYYVAIEEPGADNDACDGLAPTDEGNGHCPFKDFTSPAVRSVLDQVNDVRLEVRTGTYAVQGWEGIRVSGLPGGTAPAVLSAYPGEQPILDVAEPDGASCVPPKEWPTSTYGGA